MGKGCNIALGGAKKLFNEPAQGGGAAGLKKRATQDKKEPERVIVSETSEDNWKAKNCGLSAEVVQLTSVFGRGIGGERKNWGGNTEKTFLIL